jgi:hypothetical protein
MLKYKIAAITKTAPIPKPILSHKASIPKIYEIIPITKARPRPKIIP